jgi:hypothetical protein
MLFDIGDTAHIAITFADLNGTPTNPSTVVLTIQAPDGTQTTPGTTNDGSGLYHYDLAVAQSGIYRFKWVGTGAINAVEEGEIAVKESILVAQPPGTIIVRTLIEAGLRLAGLMDSARRKASPEQLDEGVETYNSMIDAWAAQGWLVPCKERTVFPLTSLRKAYTIGPAETSPNFATAKPARITDAGLVLTNQTPNPEWPLDILTQQDYALVRNKDWTSSWPIAVYYEPTSNVSYGTLFFYPIPSTVNSVALYLEAALNEVQGLTTGVILARGTRLAIEQNLGQAIAARNPRTARPGPTLREDAAESIEVIQRLNWRPLSRRTDLPTHHTRSNIYGGREGR